jgi:putative DNA primase/helicase
MDNYGSLPAARKQSDHTQILKALRTRATKPLKTLTAKGLNFANGFLTADLELKAHHPDHGCTYMLSFRYLSEQPPSPQWETFLYELWGEDEDYEQKVLALQEALAVTLFGVSPSYERAICLYGPKGSGKSRVLKLIEKIVPSEVLSAVNPSEWNDTYLPAELFGKLVNVAGELGENAEIKGRRFKEIISGHTITAQRKYGQPFQFQPDCSHWFTSNHLPLTDDSDGGFSRRWLFLRFDRTVPEARRIPDLENHLLSAEGEEILNWAVRGIRRVVEQRGYTLPVSHQFLERQLEGKANCTRFFLENCPELKLGCSDTTFVTFADLYSTYSSFILGSGLKTLGTGKFRERLDTLQHEFGFRLRKRPSPNGRGELVCTHMATEQSLRRRAS